ncbi:MAG: hypothetical protein WBN99_10090 [Mycobacterium sp.]
MGMTVAPAGAADAIPALADNAADATTAAVTSTFALRRAINVNPSVVTRRRRFTFLGVNIAGRRRVMMVTVDVTEHAGLIDFYDHDGIRAFTYTDVDPAFGGRGAAGGLLYINAEHDQRRTRSTPTTRWP